MPPATVEPPVVRRNDTAVKVDAEVISEAKMVAASRGTSLAEYISEILRPIVHHDLEEEMNRRLRTGKSDPAKPKRPKGSTD
jgi:hypothetical protein